ncbi:MAG: competence/damage-inducible protein A [Thermoplasmata archaeon]|nr:competence/damage-inducible protein A [Thermoplasmata archaeon]
MVKVGTLVVGNEILGGKTVDTNTQKMIKLLFSRGLKVSRWCVVPDDVEEISAEVERFARDGYDLLIVSGGMGPTHDDITVEAMARGVGKEMVRSLECYGVMEGKYRERYGKGPMRKESLASMEKMCKLPDGFSLIPNGAGMAEGLYGPLSERGIVVMLPGVPREYEAIMNHPQFLELLPDGEDLVSVDIHFKGRESQLSILLENIQKEYPGLEIGSYPQGKMDVIVRITGDVDEVEKARTEVQEGLNELLA